WAVIYNYREDIWYDTPLPNAGRSFGITNDVTQGNFFSGVDLYNASTYRLWQHEIGMDEIDVSNINAIDSYYTSNILTAEAFQHPADKDVHIDTIIPDFVQAGQMSVTPIYRGNARSAFVNANPVKFDAVPATTNDQQVPVKVSARQIKLKFESNA